jgi:NAD+ kinase
MLLNSKSFKPKQILIAVHSALPKAEKEAQAIEAFLSGYPHLEVFRGSLYDERIQENMSPDTCDVMIALGGDGMMLRAGRMCAPLGIPVLGINVGHFGFLTEFQENQWQETLPRLMTGEFRIENRLMLNVEHFRGEDSLGTWEALNEAVICRGQAVRPLQLTTYVDEYEMAWYSADGLIASTATGSTAYALAVGGPIMPPDLQNILVIPIAPHLSMDRAVILPHGSCVTVKIHTHYDAVLSVDGQKPETILDGDRVRISTSEHFASFIRFQDPGYFYRNLSQYMEQNPLKNNHDTD